MFDTSAAVQGVQLSTLPPPLPITTTVTSYEPGHFALTLSAPAPRNSALVVSENFYPGWKATVNGKAVPVERADFVLMGVALPEQATRVEFTFASGTYERGKWITLIALAIAILAAIGGAVRDRRPGIAASHG